MLQKITDKDIINTILEVRSHTGLPIKVFRPMFEMLWFTKNNVEFNSKSSILNYLDMLINKAIIEIHNSKRRGVNKNLKSYDW